MPCADIIAGWGMKSLKAEALIILGITALPQDCGAVGRDGPSMDN